jgi:protein TonB
VVSYYPERAVEDEVDGLVTVDCSVGLDGSILDCKILNESPRNYGFGEAMRRMAVEQFRLDPESIEGGIKVGARAKLTWRWAF